MGRTGYWLLAAALIVSGALGSGCGDKPIVDTGEQATIEGSGLELPKAYADQIRKKYPHAEIQFFFERRKANANGTAFCTFYKDSSNLKDPKHGYGVVYFNSETHRMGQEFSRILVREANDMVVDQFREDYPDYRIWQMYRIKYPTDYVDSSSAQVSHAPGSIEYQFWALDDKSMMVVTYGSNRHRIGQAYMFDSTEFHYIPPTSIPSEVSNGLYRALGYTTRYGAGYLELYGDKVYKIYTNVPEDMSRLQDLPGSFRRRELWPRMPLIVMVDSKGNLIDTYFGYPEN